MGQGVYVGEGSESVETVPDDVYDGEVEDGAELAEPLVGQDASKDGHKEAEGLEHVDEHFGFRLGVAEDILEVLVENRHDAIVGEPFKHLAKNKSRVLQILKKITWLARKKNACLG